MNVLSSLIVAALLAAQPREIAIVAPVAQQTIFRDGGSVSIVLAARPAQGDRIIVQLDDRVTLLPPGENRLVMADVARGTHVLYAFMVTADGERVADTETIVFYMGDATNPVGFTTWLRV